MAVELSDIVSRPLSGEAKSTWDAVFGKTRMERYLAGETTEAESQTQTDIDEEIYFEVNK